VISEHQSLEDLLAASIVREMADNEQMIARLAEKIIEKVNSGPAWFNMKDAAAHIGMDYSKFTKHVRAGELPSHVIHGCVRIYRLELDEWCKGL
jgi:hypothetical protein